MRDNDELPCSTKNIIRLGKIIKKDRFLGTTGHRPDVDITNATRLRQ